MSSIVFQRELNFTVNNELGNVSLHMHRHERTKLYTYSRYIFRDSLRAALTVESTLAWMNLMNRKINMNAQTQIIQHEQAIQGILTVVRNSWP